MSEDFRSKTVNGKNNAHSTFLNRFAEQLDHVHSFHSAGLEALRPGYQNALKPNREMWLRGFISRLSLKLIMYAHCMTQADV